MWIRLLLVLAVCAVALVLLKGHRGARHQAIRRLLLLGFTTVAGLSVLFPGAWTALARLLGVGRGTDLLLYGLIVAFLGFVATSYLRFRDLQHQLTELSRRLALDEAPAPRAEAQLVDLLDLAAGLTADRAVDGTRAEVPTPRRIAEPRA
jgi:small membrane protein